MGSASALYNLAYLLDTGEGVAKNEVQARTLYEKAAALGNVNAQINLGRMYRFGRGGLTKDETKALEYFNQAAEKGLAVAYVNIGSVYEDRPGRGRDLAQARNWYSKAAAVGDLDAKSSLSRLDAYPSSASSPAYVANAADEATVEAARRIYVSEVRDDDVAAIKARDERVIAAVRPLAERGHPLAQILLAKAHAKSGYSSVGLAWFERFVDATSRLSESEKLEVGRPLNRDVGGWARTYYYPIADKGSYRALAYATRVAELTSDNAKRDFYFNLFVSATSSLNGKAAMKAGDLFDEFNYSRDRSGSVNRYTKTLAEKGNPFALVKLGDEASLLEAGKTQDPEIWYEIGRNFSNEKYDSFKAEAWLLKAANGGYAAAYYELGNLHLGRRSYLGPWGAGLEKPFPKDEAKASQYHLQGARAGDKDCQSSIASRYEGGIGVTQDYGQAFYWRLQAAQQGDVISQSVVGQYYYKGLGVSRDVDRARYWLRSAAAKGVPSAQQALRDWGL